jgi:hypothetical protein
MPPEENFKHNWNTYRLEVKAKQNSPLPFVTISKYNPYTGDLISSFIYCKN